MVKIQYYASILFFSNLRCNRSMVFAFWAFYPIGKFLKHIGNDAIGELTREDKNKKEKKTEDNE